jgi:hypothetical protein
MGKKKKVSPADLEGHQETEIIPADAPESHAELTSEMIEVPAEPEKEMEKPVSDLGENVESDLYKHPKFSKFRGEK